MTGDDLETGESASFTYALITGSATLGDDFSAASPTTVTLNGDLEAPHSETFNITIHGENIVETNETFQIQLTAASGNVPVTYENTPVTVTITNDDTAALGINAVTASVPEGTAAQFQITEANGVTLDQTYTITLSYGGDVDPDADLPARPLTVEVGPGTAFPYSFDIPVATDDLIEGPRVDGGGPGLTGGAGQRAGECGGYGKLHDYECGFCFARHHF